jgi:hypothetical protein
MVAFHHAHFSAGSTSYFATHFLGPADEPDELDYAEEEDDGLGYYDDGVKRTLTDEQIAMFRHSEIQALLRERRYAEEAKADGTPSMSSKEPVAGDGEEGGSPGDIQEEHRSIPSHDGGNTTANGKGKKKGKNGRNQKPDLRKRTWDKVDEGLEKLDYGEEEAPASKTASRGMQRRKISYDDV